MQFYVLERKPTDERECARTDALEAEGYHFGQAPICPVCGNCIGTRPWLPPWRVEIETWGKEFGDFAFNGPDWFLVSPRFKEIYDSNGLRGLSAFVTVPIAKVRRYRKLRGDCPTYMKVDVARTRAAVDFPASGFEWSEEPVLCPECLLPTNKTTFKRRKGLVIHPETWEGHDIFMARGTGEFFASGRFKQVCEANDVKNAVFFPAEHYGENYYPWEQKDWHIRHFDETVSLLECRNDKGQYDRWLEVLAKMRDRVSADPSFQWGLEFDKEFSGNTSELTDAMSEAYYKLKRSRPAST